jgi:hypothetical protein
MVTYIDAFPDQDLIIDQDPSTGYAGGWLDTIVDLNFPSKGGPWWAYTPITQPYEWSSISYDGHIGDPYTALRGFPYCEEPYCTGEPFGTDYYPPPVPGNYLRLPRIGEASAHGVMPNGALLAPYGFKSLNDAAWDAYVNSGGSCTKLNFLQPPQHRYFDPSSGYGGFRPNIWQIMALDKEQPWKLDPLNPGQKIYLMPTQKVQDTIAPKFLKAWNDTTNAYNKGEVAMNWSVSPLFFAEWRDAITGAPYEVAINASYPGPNQDWKFPIKMVDGPVTTDGVIGRWDYNVDIQDFAAGLPPAGWWQGQSIYPSGTAGGTANYGYTLWAFHSAYAVNIAGGQLDPKLWDTTGDVPIPTKANRGPPYAI